ncbi:MAG: hypothetical protein HQL10_04995 [Nitrospirae bacterium]|nr:hypothetical protein [Nitrospirota bacterium]
MGTRVYCNFWAAVFLCIGLLLTASNSFGENKYKLSTTDPGTKQQYDGSIDFYPTIQKMVYHLRVFYNDNFYRKGPHLLFSFEGDWNKSRDINGDGAVNYYDFIDSILPLADVSNAKGFKYKGEGNVYLRDFKFILAKDGLDVRTISGNVGTVNSGMQYVFGQYNKACADDDRYLCIPVDAAGPGNYTVSYQHPKLGRQTIGVFSVIDPNQIMGGSYNWVEHIKSGRQFKVVFDAASKKFQDTDRMGAVNPMGTIKGGETYTVVYDRHNGWTATGYNKGTGGFGSWTYQPGSPENHELDIWGRVFKFSDNGEVFDIQHGLVGRLIK